MGREGLWEERRIDSISQRGGWCEKIVRKEKNERNGCVVVND